MVEKIREIEKLMGKEVKKPTSGEKKNIKKIRRGLVYKRNLDKNYIKKKK